MKKALLLLSAFLLVFSLNMNAQTKEQALSNIDKAKEATSNPKKAASPVTWIKLAEAYINAQQFPYSNLRPGASELEEKLFLKDQKMISAEKVNLAGQSYNAKTYDDKVIYYNDKGALDAIIITKPLSQDNLLEKAYDALLKAAEVDAKGKKKADIVNTMKRIKDIYVNDGMSYNIIGDVKKACDNFEASLKYSDNPIVGEVDSLITYYTALTARMVKDYERAQKYYDKCLAINYEQNGEVFSGLAEAYSALNNKEKSKEVLNAGFVKYPNSQSILVSLINLYLETNDDPNKVLSLIRTAQKNEPKNASLYLAEGNVFKEMKDYDNAIKCYEKSNEIDPSYAIGLYYAGSTYYDIAVEVQEEINKLDVNDTEKYDQLSKDIDEDLKKSLPYFEKAFAGSDNVDLKKACAEYMKLIYFRYRDQQPEYKTSYEKYNKFLQDNQ